MGVFGSIEQKSGVDRPDYQLPPPLPDVAAAEDEWGHTLGICEALVSFVLPIAGLGLSIWRFGRGDSGPGVADLLLGIVGAAVVYLVLV